MNAQELFVAIVVGLAMPLALVDGLRALLSIRLPVQSDGLQLERRALPWLLAILAGPGLLVERLVAQWHEDSLAGRDLLAGMVIVLGWSCAYGFVVLRAVSFLTAQAI